MDANKTMDLIPEEFESLEAAAEFWDTHSLADYWGQTVAVHFDVELQRRVFLVPLEWSLANRLMAAARAGIDTRSGSRYPRAGWRRWRGRLSV